LRFWRQVPTYVRVPGWAAPARLSKDRKTDRMTATARNLTSRELIAGAALVARKGART